MIEKIFAGHVDIATSVAYDIDAAAAEYEGKYSLNEEARKRFLSAYRKLKRMLELHEGEIIKVDVRSVDKSTIVVETLTVDAYNESLDIFSDLLASIDFINMSAANPESVLIEVGVKGMWKAV